MKKQLLFSILFLFNILFLQAQELIKELNYPKGMMTNPLKIPISLAGNYGECRPNHFHSGIDVRTNKEENQPVLAIADGYISKPIQKEELLDLINKLAVGKTLTTR